MRIGVIGLSFALREEKEPNPCNMKLAREFERIVALEKAEGHNVFGVIQWEIALAPIARKIRIYNVKFVVERHRDGVSYLDTDEVLLQSKNIFKGLGGVDEVVVIANPWVHLQGARFRAKAYGFKVRKRRIRWIGFDKLSTQWWTRGPVQAFVYTVGRAIGQVFGRRFGQNSVTS